jgi:tetratricopeptide (TPR) repeat protein
MKFRFFLFLLCPALLLLPGCTGSKVTQSGGATLKKESPKAEKRKERKKRITFEEVESNDVPALMKQAKEFQEINQLKKAIAYLRKVKQLKPDSVVVRETLVSLYKEMDLPDFELIELKGLIEIKPDNTQRIRYAALLRKNKAYDEAINAIEDVRAVDPENIPALLELGQIYTDQKMYPEAIETFREVTYIDAKNAMAKYYQAEIYLAQNKPRWADKYYKDALKKDPKLGIAVFGLAKIAKMYNNEENYRMHLERARELSPDDPEILKAYME